MSSTAVKAYLDLFLTADTNLGLHATSIKLPLILKSRLVFALAQVDSVAGYNKHTITPDVYTLVETQTGSVCLVDTPAINAPELEISETALAVGGMLSSSCSSILTSCLPHYLSHAQMQVYHHICMIGP